MGDLALYSIWVLLHMKIKGTKYMRAPHFNVAAKIPYIDNIRWVR